MSAAEREDVERFNALYDDLESICIEHDGSKKDHPMQWEALADFTEEFEDAIELYEKALELAKAQREFEYQASILFSMARVWVELEKPDAAREAAQASLDAANKAQDEDLLQEVQQWLDEYKFYDHE